MKLLTWMHRKFRQGNNETLKEYPLGQSLLDDHHIYQKQNHGSGTFRQVHRDGQVRKSFASLETTRLADLEENSSADFSEYFEGFLAIGTLGTETVISEPETPTFAVSFEKLAETENEMSANELRLINDELEKVLAAEARDDGWTDSSGRNSQVSNGRISNGRISHASSITLSGKPLEIPESTASGNLVCPLQEYLLGSAVELPEKVTAPKKEHRTSLGELFERHKAEEISDTKCKRGEKREDKDGDKTSMNLMKKILKKKTVHTSSRGSSATTRGTTETASAETKLCKILQKFHKKVHPESSTATENSDKPHKIRIKEMIPGSAGYYKEGHTLPDENIRAISHRALRNSRMRHSKSCSNPTHLIVGGSDSNGSRECWIKTDADYLVLEL